MKSIFIILFTVAGLSLAAAQTAPESITLEYCYEQVYENYPSASKADVQAKITELNNRIARSGWYPEVDLSARTSYQSDVTELPFAGPGLDLPDFSHDHYRISLDVSQPIFDGGRVGSSSQLQEYAGRSEQAAIQTELWSVRGQVDQVYFGILMMKKQRESLELMLEDLNEQLSMVGAQVNNGVMLPGNELVLKAERIKAEQSLTRLDADIRAGYRVLSEILGVSISGETELEVPDITGPSYSNQQTPNRAEYDLFEANKLGLEAQRELNRADRLPTVAAFATSAYGRPGYNVFNDDLQFNWIVGIRAQWSFRNWNNASRKMEVLELEKRKLDADREAFTRRLNAELHQSEEQIEALEEQLEQDEEVLELRREIVAEKQSLLEQGAITSTEYITELNAENRARIELEIRRIQALKATAELATKKGKPWD